MWNTSTVWRPPGAVPILLTPIAGGAEANREHARRVIDLVDGLLITGGGDVHPRYYVPDPAKNRDALGLDDLAAMGCGSSSHCRSTGAKVPFCGHYVPDRTFEEAMDGTSDRGNGGVPGRSRRAVRHGTPAHSLPGRLARRLRGSRRFRAGARPSRPRAQPAHPRASAAACRS